MQSSKEREKLLGFITEELLRKGIKALTMDSLAAALQMSKRTLYEIFGSKENMVDEALKSFHDKLMTRHREILENSSHVMEAMVKILADTRNWMSIAGVNFFRDIVDYYQDDNKRREASECRHAEMEKLFRRGAEEGYFRTDLNFTVQCRMLTIQMESLKRMEELFPPDITLVEVYEAISLGFMRSISSLKGLEFLDQMDTEFNTKK